MLIGCFSGRHDVKDCLVRPALPYDTARYRNRYLRLYGSHKKIIRALINFFVFPFTFTSVTLT